MLSFKVAALVASFVVLSWLQAPRQNVLLVTIDTLRADRVGAYGAKGAVTTTLDALAKDGVRFADAVAHVPLTYPSHVAILTGHYPGDFGVRSNGAPILPAEATTLAEQLRGAGYNTGAFIGSAVLDGAFGLDQGFATYDDDFAPSSSSSQIALSELQRPAGEVVAAAERWIGAQREPWFAWVHLYDPHLPYDAPPEYLKRTGGGPYDAEVAYADAMLGRLLERIDRTRTFVIATSDHGEGLGDHGELDHGFFIYDSTIKVPLIIAGPGIKPGVVKEQVRLVDVAPTIHALLNVNALPDLDGTSLATLISGGARTDIPPSLTESWYPRLHFGWSELRGVRVGDFMFIAAPKPELYDLRSDPLQQTNIVERRAPIAARLSTELAALSAPSTQHRAPALAPDSETIRRLQALGYVGSFAPVTSTPGDDPKDHVKDYRAYRDLLNSGLGALERGRPAAAVPLLQKLVKLNVRGFEAHLYLGNAYAATGKLDAALGEYEVALQLNPDVTMPRFEIAKVYAEQGNTPRAIAAAKQGLEREPRSFYGWYTLGVVHMRARQYADAYRAFTQAVQLNSRDARAAANLGEAAMRTSQLDVARQQFERMIQMGYRPAPAHYNLGLLAQRRGDTAGARTHFAAALKADPTFAPAKDALTKLK